MSKELTIVLQANYGDTCGWEDIAQYKCGARRINYGKAVRESRQDLKDYRENEPSYNYRIIRRYTEII